MLDPKQPLWLPEGSLRGIVLLTLVFAVVAAVFTERLDGQTLKELALFVFGFYFSKGVDAVKAAVKPDA